MQATCISALSNWVSQHRISLKRRHCAAERGIAWAGAVWTGTFRDALEGPLLVFQTSLGHNRPPTRKTARQSVPRLPEHTHAFAVSCEEVCKTRMPLMLVLSNLPSCQFA